MNPVYILSAVRTAIGAFGGALRDHSPGALAAAVTRESVAQAQVDPAAVGHVVMGQVIPTGPRDAYLARVAALDAGLEPATPAMTINRLCGSGLQAVLSAAQSIALGDCDLAVGGGAEIMSRAPFLCASLRWGQRMGDAPLVDALAGTLTDPFGNGLMGVTAENVAALHGISRDEQDAAALESHRRAAAAADQGRFAGQILPIALNRKGADVRFASDEHVRKDLRRDDLERLRPLFRTEGGTVTAGNASGINDGAAAIVLAGEHAAGRARALARLVAYGHAGVDPAVMGMGPVPATRLALQRAGLTISDIDVIESNEAFAAQACAVARVLGLDPARVNPNGGAIALGHPVGATGAIILTKLVHELRRTSGRYGLATMCIGGGQGIAVVIENCG